MNTDQFAIWAEYILAYAHDHYEEDGWDYICECYAVDDIVDLISSCTSYDEAIYVVAEVAHVYDERRTEIQAEIF